MHTTGTQACPPSLVILKVRPVLGDRVVAELRWEDTALDPGTWMSRSCPAGFLASPWLARFI